MDPETPHIDIADFELKNATFEVRFHECYLHWDRAGSIWTEAVTKWPKLEVIKGEPSTTAFRLEDSFQLSVHIDRANIIALKPQSTLRDLMEMSDIFIPIVVKRLEIRDFSRVALRLTYFKSYPDKASASSAFVTTQALRIPTGSHFGIEGTPLFPEYSLRLEGESRGATVRMKAVGRKLDFVPPAGAEGLTPLHEEKYGFEFDVDYFTIASVGIGQISFGDWIKQALHLIRRDSSHFLRGA
jgi:hypothetical protein